MINTETFRHMVLAFPGATEEPHFEKASFRVNKKIFATLSIENQIACIKLSELDQSVFCAYDKTIIYPVPNKWGKQGWTNINLKKIRKEMLRDALSSAYTEVANKKRIK